MSLYSNNKLFAQNHEIYVLSALKNDPNNPDLNFDLGLIYKNKGNLKLAYDFFQKVLTINENDSDALFWAGYILRQQNKLGLAAEKLEKSTQINPNNSYAWFELGIINGDRTYNNKAIECFKKSAELASAEDKKTKEDAIFYIGLLYLNMKDVDKVLFYEKELRALNPEKANDLKDLLSLYH